MRLVKRMQRLRELVQRIRELVRSQKKNRSQSGVKWSCASCERGLS